MSAKIVVNCGKKDLLRLKRLGFKVEISDDSGSVFEMIHKHASSRVVGAVLGLAGRGHVLFGSIADPCSDYRMLFVGSGSQALIVPANADMTKQAWRHDKDGQPVYSSSSADYWSLLNHTTLLLWKDVLARGTGPEHP